MCFDEYEYKVMIRAMHYIYEYNATIFDGRLFPLLILKLLNYKFNYNSQFILLVDNFSIYNVCVITKCLFNEAFVSTLYTLTGSD